MHLLAKKTATILAALVIAIAASATARAEAPSGCFGQVRGVAGKVEFQEPKSNTWKPVTADLCLYDDYGLRTAANSGALVVLDDMSMIRLNENTEIFFTSVMTRFMLTRLTGIAFKSGELFFDITEGYDEIMVQSDSGGVAVSGASADLMILREDEKDPKSPSGTAVFVLEGAVYAFDVFLKYRITVGPEQQTNIARRKPPQEAYFFNVKVFKAYVKAWRDRLMPGKVLPALVEKAGIADMRNATLACPSDYYKSSLWCCPNACAAGPSDLPQDIFCPANTYYAGNRRCCDNECMVRKY